ARITRLRLRISWQKAYVVAPATRQDAASTLALFAPVARLACGLRRAVSLSLIQRIRLGNACAASGQLLELGRRRFRGKLFQTVDQHDLVFRCTYLFDRHWLDRYMPRYLRQVTSGPSACSGSRQTSGFGTLVSSATPDHCES